MNYKIKYTRQIVYLFTAVPIALLVLAIVFLAIKQNMFEKRYYYYSLLSNANGISTQTPLLYKGFEIGRVTDFELTDKGEIQIKFYILKRFSRVLVTESVISRTSNPITNKTNLEYVENTYNKTQIKPGSIILSTDFPEGKALFRKISPLAVDALAGIINNVNLLTTELNRDNNADKGAIFRLLTNLADVSEKTDRSMAAIEKTMVELNTFAQNLNKDNNADQGATFRILTNVADITSKLDAQMGQIDQLLTSLNKTAANFENPDSLIVKMIDPSGELLIKPIQQTLNTINSNLEQTYLLLNTLNRNNPDLLLLINNMNETLSKASQTLEGLNNNPILRSGISPSTAKPAAAPSRITELPGN